MRKEYEKILDSFLREGDEDYIGLWQIINRVSRIIGVHSSKLSAAESEKLLDAVLEFVTIMLQNGFIAVNLADKDGYTAWSDQNPTSVTKKIRDEWIRLKGMNPNVGFIVWFNKIGEEPTKQS